jgi:hypothetical protein
MQPVRLTNQFAAMPSLHDGWSVFVGIPLALAIRRPAADAFAVLIPTAMALLTDQQIEDVAAHVTEKIMNG